MSSDLQVKVKFSYFNVVDFGEKFLCGFLGVRASLGIMLAPRQTLLANSIISPFEPFY